MAAAATLVSPDAGAKGQPLPLVRTLVRDILQQSPGFKQLDPQKRRELASAMVRVCHAGASLIHEELKNRERLDTLSSAQAVSGGRAAASRALEAGQSVDRRLSRAQGAGSDFSGVAAQRVAGTTQAILNAVSFPRFVTDLINGVFKAMISSNMQQMNSYVELLNNVSASLEGFSQNNSSDDGARQWLVEKFPGSFEIVGQGTSGADASDGPQIQLKDGAQMPSEAALKAAFGLGDTDSVPSGDPETALLPFARIQMARQRQQMLATMVMLGMQRIVIDSGKITAAMRFHIDTRSAAQDEQGSKFSEQNQISASGSFGYGPWGVSASMTNNIGYVSTQTSQTTEEMNTSVDLNSSVEINFRSDFLPLNRMASPAQASRIKANTLNPQAESDITAREKMNADSDAARRAALGNELQPFGSPSTPAPGAPGSLKAAQDARSKGGEAVEKAGGAGTASSDTSAGKSAAPAATAKPQDKGSAAPPTGSTPPQNKGAGGQSAATR